LKKEGKEYHHEKKTEEDNSRARMEYFKAKMKSLIDVNKKMKSDVVELIGSIEKVKRGLETHFTSVTLPKE
jgi:hypothetical protein